MCASGAPPHDVSAVAKNDVSHDVLSNEAYHEILNSDAYHEIMKDDAIVLAGFPSDLTVGRKTDRQNLKPLLDLGFISVTYGTGLQDPPIDEHGRFSIAVYARHEEARNAERDAKGGANAFAQLHEAGRRAEARYFGA